MNEVTLERLAVAPSQGLRRLDDVRERVHADSLGNWDTFASPQQLSLENGQLSFGDGSGAETRLTPTNWATAQLCARLGIPATYFRKCPSDLQDVQANHWLREVRAAEDKGETKWMLRAKDETLRAVLSERYSPLDNNELLEALTPTLNAHHRVDWFALADEGLHLRIVDPNRVKEVLPDDALSVGIHIANSEVGLRSITVDALVYRLVCTNGLIRLVKGKSLLRQRHVHIAPARLVASLEEAVASAWNEAEGFLDQMKRTTQMPVDDVEGTIERLGERWHLSKPVQDDLLVNLRREPARVQETVYGVVNALTNVAQRLSSEARYDMEVLAGHLAEHGVSAYAPKRSKSQRVEPVEIEGTESSEPSETVKFDAVEVAREMFEAEVMSRRPTVAPASQEVAKA